MLLACMVSVALLGPLLVAFAAWLAKPTRAVGGAPARLALAAISAQPRRAASAVIPIAMATAMIGTIYFAGTSIQHATATQAASTVTAGQVISGTDLTAAIVRQVQALPGVRAAAGVRPVSVAATDPDLEQVYGEAVTAGPLGQLLDLGVTSGSTAAPGPGQIAVSALEAGPGVLGVHTGSRVTVYLPDGTPYHATVSAIYSRSLASGDLLIPASVAAGHTGTPATYSQILVSGGTPAELAGLATGHPGLHVTSRAVANAQSAQAAAQNSFANNLIFGVIAVLCAVALVNTLVVTTVERRRVLRLLGRVGATRGQVAAAFGWYAVFVACIGLVAGAGAGAVALLTVTRAITGAWTPYIPLSSALALVALVAAITAAAVMIPVRMMSRREPTLTSS
jgi:putative ABC transport system permease protein